jgi:hypothetical protein
MQTPWLQPLLRMHERAMISILIPCEATLRVEWQTPLWNVDAISFYLRNKDKTLD